MNADSATAHWPRNGRVATSGRMDNDTAFKRVFNHRVMVCHPLD